MECYGETISGNLLDNTIQPPGTTIGIRDFSINGLPAVFIPGSAPITVVNPLTQLVTGALVVLSTGAWTFTPAPGYVGSVPAIMYNVSSSDGQTDPSVLTIDVFMRKSLDQ